MSLGSSINLLRSDILGKILTSSIKGAGKKIGDTFKNSVGKIKLFKTIGSAKVKKGLKAGKSMFSMIAGSGIMGIFQGFMSFMEKLGVFDPIIQVLSAGFEILGGIILQELMPTMMELITILLSPENMELLKQLGLLFAEMLKPMFKLAVMLLPILIPAITSLVKVLIPLAPYFTAFRYILLGINAVMVAAIKMWNDAGTAIKWVTNKLNTLINFANSFAKVGRGSGGGGGSTNGSSNPLGGSLLDVIFGKAAQGAYIKGGVGGALMLTGEGRNDEWIFNEPQLRKLLNEVSGGSGGGQNVTINLQGGVYTKDFNQLTEMIARKLGLWRG